MPGKGAKGHMKLIISVLAGNFFFLVFVCFFFFNPQKYLTQLLFFTVPLFHYEFFSHKAMGGLCN